MKLPQNSLSTYLLYPIFYILSMAASKIVLSQGDIL